MTIESATDGDVFLAYLEQVLCPLPGQVVIMDNLAAHKVKASAMADSRVSKLRALAARRSCLILDQACSMGLKSGV
jgi:hypothetical protein